MNKNDLRKCTCYLERLGHFGKNIYQDGEYYFHCWTMQGRVQRHPDYSSGDTTYAEVFAIVEHIESGKVQEVDPHSITFIN